MTPETLRRKVRERDQGICRRCGRPGNNQHHRINRGMGGSDDPRIINPANVVTVCGSGTTGCHGWIGQHPEAAYETGWSIRRNSRELPFEVPMECLNGRELWLSEEGTAVYTDEITDYVGPLRPPWVRA